MSKNTNSEGFRKIDIDKFDPESYQDDDQTSAGQGDDVGPNEQEVISLLNRFALKHIHKALLLTSNSNLASNIVIVVVL